MGLFDRLTPREGEEEYSGEETVTGAKKEIPAPAISGKAKNQFVILRPNDPSDDQLISIAEHLMNLQSVIVNLELIGKDAKHFIDFLSGVAYALQGTSRKVAQSTYLFAPGGIEISGDIESSLDLELKF